MGGQRKTPWSSSGGSRVVVGGAWRNKVGSRNMKVMSLVLPTRPALRGPASRIREALFPLGSANLGPHLEDWVPLWVPQSRKDRDRLGRTWQSPARRAWGH